MGLSHTPIFMKDVKNEMGNGVGHKNRITELSWSVKVERNTFVVTERPLAVHLALNFSSFNYDDDLTLVEACPN